MPIPYTDAIGARWMISTPCILKPVITRALNFACSRAYSALTPAPRANTKLPAALNRSPPTAITSYGILVFTRPLVNLPPPKHSRWKNTGSRRRNFCHSATALRRPPHDPQHDFWYKPRPLLKEKTMLLQAYKVEHLLVFAFRGTEAKVLAAPQLRPMEEWREDVAAWVALRADRSPELDHLVDPARTEPYIHGPS